MMIQNGNAMIVFTDGVQEMSECPKCGGTDIAMILWGFPPDSEFLKEEVKKKKIVLLENMFSLLDQVMIRGMQMFQ